MKLSYKRNKYQIGEYFRYKWYLGYPNNYKDFIFKVIDNTEEHLHYIIVYDFIKKTSKCEARTIAWNNWGIRQEAVYITEMERILYTDC